MPARERAQWALAVFLSLALLMSPALWNGFPLLQYDTGGYLARWYEGILVPSRAVVYGLILNAGVPLGLWPVVLLQSALTVWIVALMLRAHKLGKRPWLLLGTVAALTVCTTLPWLSAILLTDIFCGLGVLALYLLLMRGDLIARWEHFGLIALIAVAAATHSATLAVLLALLLAAVVLFLFDRRRIRIAGIGRGLLALALGAALVFAADYVVAKRLAWTPGGFALSFGRMLQDGIVAKYLDEHCPAAKLTLCAYKDELPRDADVWFWGTPLFDRLGRFAGLGDEMEEIAIKSVLAYPVLQAETALIATGKQLIDVRSGEGVVNDIWHTYAIVERFTPQLVPAMRAARQQAGDIGFTAINRLHYPLALIAMALLPLILWLAWRRLLPSAIGELAATVMLALLANAFVCGALSNPHDRYGARMVWLASLAVALAIVRNRGPARDISPALVS
ncbi:MAG: hypothetical protein HY244_12560 [Rhizobiales bacterium]|nr:hypothetical protein [Hyphomicrobiales bacterium]